MLLRLGYRLLMIVLEVIECASALRKGKRGQDYFVRRRGSGLIGFSRFINKSVPFFLVLRSQVL